MSHRALVWAIAWCGKRKMVIHSDSELAKTECDFVLCDRQDDALS
jgi:hypothetical protein